MIGRQLSFSENCASILPGRFPIRKYPHIDSVAFVTYDMDVLSDIRTPNMQLLFRSKDQHDRQATVIYKRMSVSRYPSQHVSFKKVS